MKYEACIVVCSIGKPNHKRGEHIWFFAVGLGKENTRAGNGWPMKKFSTLVSDSGDANVSASDTLILW